ncbi:MAG: hypothetical protein WCE24_10920, partial [Pseudolabrys sp.]
LKTSKESDEATEQVRRLGLPIVRDLCKNWDTLAALDCILDSTSTSAKILDAGAAFGDKADMPFCTANFRL